MAQANYNKRRILPAIMAATVLLSATQVGAYGGQQQGSSNGYQNAQSKQQSSSTGYSDVSSSDWYYSYVQEMVDAGVMSSTNGKFNPQSTVTGGMFLTMLGRLVDADVSSYEDDSTSEDTTSEDTSSEDTSSEDTASEDASSGASGHGNSSFAPGQNGQGGQMRGQMRGQMSNQGGNGFDNRGAGNSTGSNSSSSNASEKSASSSSASSSNYYSAYVSWAEDEGLLDDIASFDENDAITREEICSILYHYLDSQDISMDSSDITDLEDYSSIDDAYVDAVSAMIGEEIFKVSNNKFSPDGTVSRGQLAAILNRVANVLDIDLGDSSDSSSTDSTDSEDEETTDTETVTSPYVSSLSATLEVDGDEDTSSDDTISAEDEDASAVLVKNGGSLTMSGDTVTKSGDTSSTASSILYGLNAALLNAAGSTTEVSDTDITTEDDGASGIFSTGSDAEVTADSVDISTSGDYARGLAATYDASISASDGSVETSGDSSAAVATGRSGGTISLDGTALSTFGEAAPLLYSTGKITATDVSGTASASQAAIIKGAGSVMLKSSKIYGNGSDMDGYDSAVMFYQTSSSEATSGTGTLTVSDSTIGTSNSDAALFYVTNAKAIVNLTDSTLDFDSGILANCAVNSVSGWGTSGKNGGSLTMNALGSQALAGSILCDDDSVVALNLKETSSFEGAINSDNTDGQCSLSLASGASMSLTGNCYLTSFKDADSDYSNIDFNGYTIYVDGTAIDG